MKLEHLNILILFSTIIGMSSLILFMPDSPLAIGFMALTPLAWLSLFLLRFFTEKKRRKKENLENQLKEKKKFIDPQDYLS